jgi:hypothetical protein
MLRFPKRKRTGKRNRVEATLQSTCENFLEDYDIKFVRIPDAIYAYLMRPESPPYIKELVHQYLSGQPDLIMLKPDNRYIIVELKTDTGTVKDSQESWAKGLELNVVRDFDTFRELVERWANAQGCALCSGEVG